MIQIIHPKLDEVVDRHYSFIEPYVTSRINFYLELFNSLGNNTQLPIGTDITTRYSLTWSSIYTLIDSFLLDQFKKDVNKPNVTKADVNSMFLNSNISKINPLHTQFTFQSLFAFFTRIKDNLEDIIKGSPNELYIFIINNTFNTQSATIEKKCLELVFNYETLTGVGFIFHKEAWTSYSLTQALDLSVCPYCNRNWIVTITDSDGEKIVNPQLDHFFSKADYPVFRLSFFNLIPSCDTCNARLKGQVKFDETYLHPYKEGYNKNAFFRTIANDVDSSYGNNTEFSVNLEFGLITENTQNKILKNHNLFKIKNIYEKHGDIIAELYRLRHVYSEPYLVSLNHTFKDSNLSTEDFYRLAFKNYYDEMDFKRRPFAKLTKDVASQLKMIT